MVDILDQQGIQWINIMSYFSKQVMGFGYELVDFVGKYCLEYPDRLKPVMSADPRDDNAIARLEEFRSKHGSKWIKLHAVHQLVKPNAYRPEEGGLRMLERIYEYATSNHFPVTVHTGSSVFPRAGTKYGDPIFMDDVANDFPELKLVMAHGGRPLWMNTAFFLIKRHKNIYLDIAGIPPKRLLNYFPQFDQIIDKTVFGSDWPTLGVKSIKNNIEELKSLPLSKESARAIFHDNILKLVR